MARKKPPVTSTTTPPFDVEKYLASTGDAPRIRSYRRGTIVFAQGDRGLDVKYLQKGSIKLSVLSHTGKEAVVAMLGPGDFFGEGVLAGQSIRIATATAASASSVLAIQTDAMSRLIHEETAFADRFIAHVLGRNIRIEADLVDQLFNSSEKRLARTLLLLARYGKGNPHPTLPTRSRITLLHGASDDCIEPNLSARLAGEGVTHLLVRPDSRAGRAFFDRPLAPGLRLAARFRDGQVFAVTAPRPAIYVAAMTRFWPREHDVGGTWRWMSADAAWTVVNISGGPIVAALDLELSAFQRQRRLILIFDGHVIQTLAVDPMRHVYEAGPFAMTPGPHELVFQSAEPPAAAATAAGADPRPLSCAFGAWVWILRGQRL
jgi:CRP-like cAMP-binding protein